MGIISARSSRIFVQTESIIQSGKKLYNDVERPVIGWAVSNRWTGLLEWTTGMDYWNGLLEWTLTFFFFFLSQELTIYIEELV